VAVKENMAYYFVMGRGTSIAILFGYGLDVRKIVISLAAGGEVSSFVQNSQTGFRAQQANFSTDSGSSFVEGLSGQVVTRIRSALYVLMVHTGTKLPLTLPPF
jgi:hypothetical protein